MAAAVSSEKISIGVDLLAEAKAQPHDFDEFLQRQQLIVKTTNAKNGIDLPDVRDFQSQYFKQTANKYAWITDKSKATTFEKHVSELVSMINNPSKMADRSGKCFNHMDAISSALGADKVTKTTTKVIMLGQESKGKSTVLEALVGVPGMVYTSAKQGTRCPTFFYVYRDDGLQSPQIYWGTSNPTGKSITIQQAQTKMTEHMEKIGSGQANAVSNVPMSITIVSSTAVFEGLIIDLPGWRASISQAEDDAESKQMVKDMAFKILYEQFQDASDQSLILDIEAVTTDAASKAKSIGDIVDHFSAIDGGEEFLHKILPRTMVIVNKFNMHFALIEKSFKCSVIGQGKEAINLLLEELAVYVGKLANDYDFDPAGKLLLVGVDHMLTDDSKGGGPFGGNYDELDASFRTAIKDSGFKLTCHGIVYEVGLSLVRDQLNAKRIGALQSRVIAGAQLLNDLHFQLSFSIRKRTCTPEDAYEAVLSGHNQFVCGLADYANGKRSRDQTVMDQIYIPEAPQFQPPDLFMFLTEGGRGSGILGEIKFSKLKIFGTVISGTDSVLPVGLEHCCKSLTAHLTSLKLQEGKDGKNLLRAMFKTLMWLFQSVCYEALDTKRVEFNSTSHSQVYTKDLLHGLYAVVIEDFRAITKRLMNFVRATLIMCLHNITDIVLLSLKLSSPAFDGRLGSHISILDRDISMLQYRNRVKLAMKIWIEGVLEKYFIDSAIDHAVALRPQELLALLCSQVLSLQEQGTQVSPLPTDAREREIKKQSEPRILKMERLINGLPHHLSEESVLGWHSGPPLNLINADEVMRECLFGAPPIDSQHYNGPGTEILREKYAKQIFAALKARFLTSVLPHLATSISAGLDNPNESSESTLPNILRGVVFYRVGRPRYLTLSGVTEPRSTSTDEQKEEQHSGSYVVLPSTREDQNNILAGLYVWSDTTHANAKAAAADEDPEQLLFGILDKIWVPNNSYYAKVSSS